MKIFFLLLIFLNSLPIWAAGECNERWSKKTEIEDTYRGVSGDEPITFHFRDGLYRMPIGYAGIWRTNSIKKYMQEHRHKINIWENIDVKFWLPSLRYMELSHMSTTIRRPCEAGRPKPKAGEHVVRVRMMQPLDVPVVQRIKNYLDFRGSTIKGPIEAEFGLKYLNKDEKKIDKVFYTHKHDSKLEYELDCDFGAPNPGCSGRVYDSANDNTYYVVFSSDYIEDVHEIMKAATRLFNSWRVTAPRPLAPIFGSDSDTNLSTTMNATINVC